MLTRKNKYQYSLTIFDIKDDIKNSITDLTNDDGDIMLLGSDIFNYLTSNFATYFYTTLSEKIPSEVENSDVVTDFLRDYNNFIGREHENLQRRFLAYYKTEYNPLDNYKKMSNITTDYKGNEKDTMVFSGSEKDTSAFIGKEKSDNTRTGKDIHKYGEQTNTNTEQVSPENNNEFRNRQKNINTDNEYTNENSFENRHDITELSFDNRQNETTKTFTNRQNENTKTFMNREDEVNELTTGNIGVTSSQQMLQSEMDLRNSDLLSWLIDKFASEYLTPFPNYRQNEHSCFVPIWLEY